MTEAEFSRLWALFEELFAPSPKVKSAKVKTIWRKGTEPFSLPDVTAAVMDHARKNKFFPELSEITAGLEQDSAWKWRKNGLSPIANNARLLAKILCVPVPKCGDDTQYMQWFRRVTVTEERENV